MGASVARSDKETISQLPIESYFGDSHYLTVSDQLTALNITVYPEDSITTFPEPRFGLGNVIRVVRATPVTIKDGKKEHTLRTWALTTQELIAEQHVELADQDQITPILTAQIKPNQTVTITRVEVAEIKEKESIDFKQIKKDEPTLEKGKTRISQTGKKGERTKTYEVRRENGEETSRKLIDNSVTKEPVDEITLVGTKPVITVACRFNDLVIDASLKNNLDPNSLCVRMMKESRGNPNSDGGQYKGLFQYEEGFWASASAKAGYASASIWDAKAQIYTTAWAWSHGLRGRWPSN